METHCLLFLPGISGVGGSVVTLKGNRAAWQGHLLTKHSCINGWCSACRNSECCYTLYSKPEKWLNTEHNQRKERKKMKKKPWPYKRHQQVSNNTICFPVRNCSCFHINSSIMRPEAAALEAFIYFFYLFIFIFLPEWTATECLLLLQGPFCYLQPKHSNLNKFHLWLCQAGSRWSVLFGGVTPETGGGN